MMGGVLVIATLRFKDKERYRSYQAAFPDVFKDSGGTVLAADEAPRTLQGEDVDKIVVMRFDSAEMAQAFLTSPDYRRISKDREAGAETTSWLIKAL